MSMAWPEVTKEEPSPVDQVDCPVKLLSVSFGAKLTLAQPLALSEFCHLKTEDHHSTLPHRAVVKIEFGSAYQVLSIIPGRE